MSWKLTKSENWRRSSNCGEIADLFIELKETHLGSGFGRSTSTSTSTVKLDEPSSANHESPNLEPTPSSTSTVTTNGIGESVE